MSICRCWPNCKLEFKVSNQCWILEERRKHGTKMKKRRPKKNDMVITHCATENWWIVQAWLRSHKGIRSYQYYSTNLPECIPESRGIWTKSEAVTHNAWKTIDTQKMICTRLRTSRLRPFQLLQSNTPADWTMRDLVINVCLSLSHTEITVHVL